MMLCACLAESTIEECREVARTIDTQLVEHRIDYLESVHSLDQLYRSIPQPVIATVRPSWEGGRFDGSESSRLELLKLAIDSDCTAIDIELSMPTWARDKAIGYAKENDTLIITSKHIFSGTPELPELINIMGEMKALGADIGKIVTTANGIEDCDTVIELQKRAKAMKFSLVSFAMGDLGITTRIASLKHGAPFTYVSIGKKTAPGQLNASAMRLLLREVRL